MEMVISMIMIVKYDDFSAGTFFLLAGFIFLYFDDNNK